ncbi:hypothetical protein ACH4D5_33920 [Streptomyces sp. NPDC018029]|uniref:hypothetical protein n=1 Tax=Streptomyces sp. NPDC018029 TaxID=3365032 RepID=UPI0037B26AB0
MAFSPRRVLAHAELLAALAHLAPDTGVDQSAFATRLTTAEPEAVTDFELVQLLAVLRERPAQALMEPEEGGGLLLGVGAAAPL